MVMLKCYNCIVGNFSSVSKQHGLTKHSRHAKNCFFPFLISMYHAQVFISNSTLFFCLQVKPIRKCWKYLPQVTDCHVQVAVLPISTAWWWSVGQLKVPNDRHSMRCTANWTTSTPESTTKPLRCRTQVWWGAQQSHTREQMKGFIDGLLMLAQKANWWSLPAKTLYMSDVFLSWHAIM